MKKHVPIGLMPMRTLITNPQKMLPMTLQEWKAKINGYFQPKTPAERQKLMKYAVVMPGGDNMWRCNLLATLFRSPTRW